MSYGFQGADQPSAMEATPQLAQSQIYGATADNAMQHAAMSEYEAHARLQEAAVSAFERTIAEQANVKHAIMDKKNCISATFTHIFKWKRGAGKGRDTPASVSVSKEALKKAFGDKFDVEKQVFVHSIDVLRTHNSAPYTLTYTLSGIQGQNQDIECAYKTDGTGYTVELPPGTCDQEHAVFEMQVDNPTDLIEHGTVDLHSELQNVQPVPGYNQCLVPVKSKLGEILMNNPEYVAEKSGELFAISKDLPMLVVASEAVQEIAKSYHQDVISKLPLASLTGHSASIGRLDRTSSDTLDFADAKDAPGLSATGITHANSASHQAWVKVRLNIIDPAFLQQ